MTAKKLTPKQRDRVLRAAEVVDSGSRSYSCLALWLVGGDDLADAYASFYGRSPNTLWNWSDMPITERRQARVLLLLLFREAGGVL